MILGIYLSSGDSFTGMAKSGQDVRFKKFYLSEYAKNFSKIYIFSYLNETIKDLPENVFLIANKYNLNRYFYGLVIPFINYEYITQCNIFRVFHLTGTVPAIMGKLFLNKPFVYNYAFNYQKTALKERKWFQVALITLLNPLGSLYSAHIIAATTSVYKFIDKNKTTLIPNGVDCNIFSPSGNKIVSKTTKILSIGRLNIVKNYENLIIALKGLNAQLFIIGQGELKHKLKKLAKKNKIKLKITDKIEYLNLPRIYNQTSIFILPSFSEGSPKVLIEAMACGLPVIGSDVEGIRELIENNSTGLLCQTTSDSIREKIIFLNQNPKIAQKIGKQARLLIEKKFNLQKLLAKEIRTIKQYAT